jgi:Acetyltransferase (GNAT) domain
MAWLEPVRLQGSRASLTPLTHNHANELVEALRDGELWKLWYTSIPASDEIANFIEQRLAAQAKGTCLPFAVLDNATGKAVGMTNYLNIEPDHRRLEIGGTWYRKSVQRSQVNRSASFCFSVMPLTCCAASRSSFGRIFLTFRAVAELRDWAQNWTVYYEAIK